MPAWLLAVVLAACGWASSAGAVTAPPPAEEPAAELWKIVDLHPNQAVRDAEQQVRAAQRSGDAAGELRAWRILALAHNELLDMVALRDDVEHGEPLARDLRNIEAQIHFLAARASLARNATRYAESLALYDQAIALAERHSLGGTLAGLYLDKANVPIEQGRESDALSLFVKAYAMFESRQDRYGMAMALDGMGAAAAAAKARPEDIARGIEHHLRAIELLDAKVHRASLLTVYYNLGMAYMRANDFERAKPYMQLGQQLSQEIEGAVGTAYFDQQLARVAVEQKRYADALVHLDHALPIFRKRGDLPLMVFAVSILRADTLSLVGRGNESIEMLEDARVLAKQLDSPAWDARLHEVAATIHARLGQYEKAYREQALFSAAERRRVDGNNSQFASELRTRFEVQQKENENALLRAQQQEATARRMVLFLALSLTLVVAGALAFYLWHQVRRSRRFAALAMRDELTGMPNRRSIVEYARLQWAARSAHEGKFRLAILDLDRFKRINDDFGHDMGDAVLTAFAQVCATSLRSSDRLGRYGGEEFLLIMPGSEAAQVGIVFSRLQQAVHGLQLPGLPAGYRLSFSMGAAEAWGEHDTLPDVIHRADEALYEAKQNGRDRLESAPRVRLAAISTSVRAIDKGPGAQRS